MDAGLNLVFCSASTTIFLFDSKSTSGDKPVCGARLCRSLQDDKRTDVSAIRMDECQRSSFVVVPLLERGGILLSIQVPDGQIVE